MNPVMTANKQKEKAPAGQNKHLQNSSAAHKQTVRQPNYIEIIQRLKSQPNSLKQEDINILQKTIGNQAVIKLLSDIKQGSLKKEGKDDTADIAGAVGKADRRAEAVPVQVHNTASSEKQAEESPQENQKDSSSNANINSVEKSSRQGTPKESSSKESILNENSSKDNSQNKNVTKAVNATGDDERHTAAEKDKPAAKPVQNAVNAAKALTEKESTQINKNPEKESEQNKKEKPQEPAAAKAVKTEAGQETTGSAVSNSQNPAGASGALEAEKPEKQAVKAPAVKISGEDPSKILNQLGTVPPTEVVNAFSQAATVSEGAFEKQRAKTQAAMPEIATPTGLPAKKGVLANAAQKVKEIKHNQPAAFKSEKSGGKVQEGMPSDIKFSTDPEADADDVMNEARQFSKNSPSIGMTGEADPNQIQGFEQEAAQNVQSARQAELNQTTQDFGENSIAPKADLTKLKADKPISGVVPLGIDIDRAAPIPPEVASRVNPQLSSELKGFMQGRANEFAQGKAQFDSGVSDARQNANTQIENEKAQARENQLKEQAGARAEVGGLRSQWRTEVNSATAEYDKEAGAEAQKKKNEVGKIKDEKEADVKRTLTQAETDANKECKSAKKEAEEKKKEGEKEHKNIFQKAWDWAKDKVEKAVEAVKKAVSFVFDKLRQAVKTIFEKAKQAALGLIEAGRRLIVSAIKGLGTVLKGLVKAVFAKFPGIAKKICGLIDKAVDKAVKAVNAAANLLKKGVTAALNLLAKAVDGLFAGIQKLYKSIMAGIKKFLTLDFKKVFSVLLEAAQIAAEIALAFATGGGSVLLQIIKWLATTLPQLLRKVGAVMGFVNTIRSIKFQDIKQFLGAAGIAGFLVKGLFGELRGLPAEPKGKEEKEPGSGGAERGLLKVLHVLTGVFGVLKSVFDRIAGGLSRIVGIINISNKPWFAPFTAIYAGVVKAMELVPNPAEALNDGVDKLKEAAGEFFGSIKTKVKDIAGSIKEKVMLLGNPAQLMKLLANKAIDMVLNFIITNPPSALLKAVFKGIEAIAGKSLVELIRQYIPFADKLFDKIAASGPVQSIMKPLEGPVNSVGGMIEQVTDQAAGVVDNAEQSAMSSMGNGSKLLSGFAGSSGSQNGQAGNAGTAGDGKGQEKKGGQEGGKSQGGGDFLSLLKSGVHTRLMTFGLMNIRKLGAKVIAAGAAKVTGVIKKMLTPKVKFKLGAEEHELWVEKGKNRNVVMMASGDGSDIHMHEEVDKQMSKDVKSEVRELEQSPESKVTQSRVQKVAYGLEAGSKGEGKRKTKEPKKAYKEEVEEALTLLKQRGVPKNITFKKLLKDYQGRGKDKFTKEILSYAYYEYTGNMDQLDDINYRRILKDDGREITKKGYHAHHILYKQGLPGTIRQKAMEGRVLLIRYGIDPVTDPGNLVGAPNKGHSEENITDVVNALQRAERNALRDCEDIGIIDIDEIKCEVQKALRDVLRDKGMDAAAR